jgi:starch synthase
VHLAAEYWPLARTGGLADAVRSLANWQSAAGLPVTVLLPLYRSVRDQVPGLGPGAVSYNVQVGPRTERVSLVPNPGTAIGPRIYFIDHPASFDRAGIYGEGPDYPDNPRRFAIFCRAALAALPQIAPGPGVLHAHDWHTALAPVYLRTVLSQDPYYRELASVLSVHNAGYQGHFDQSTLADLGLPAWLWDWHWMEWYGKLNILKGGLTTADAVTTVSPTHAHELAPPTADSACTMPSSRSRTGWSGSSTASTFPPGIRRPTLTSRCTIRERTWPARRPARPHCSSASA